MISSRLQGGRVFVDAIRVKALDVLGDVKGFDCIVKLRKAVPGSLSPAEFADVCARLESFAAGLRDDIADCGIDDPEELRELAADLEYLGKWLHVDLGYAPENIREYAGELEREQEATQNWEPDEEGRQGSGSTTEYFSNADITSMFNTLIQ